MYGKIYPFNHAAVMLYLTATAVGEGLAPPAFQKNTNAARVKFTKEENERVDSFYRRPAKGLRVRWQPQTEVGEK